MYTHTQQGKIILITAFIIGFYFVFISFFLPFNLFSIILYCAIIVLLLSFSTLTIGITKKDVTIKFGIGIIQKKILLSTIENVTIVRNKWWYGWGIRFILFKNTIIYNVSGLDAVELSLITGKKIRIGTDEAKKLHKALNSSISKNNK